MGDLGRLQGTGDWDQALEIWQKTMGSGVESQLPAKQRGPSYP